MCEGSENQRSKGAVLNAEYTPILKVHCGFCCALRVIPHVSSIKVLYDLEMTFSLTFWPWLCFPCLHFYWYSFSSQYYY